MSTTSLQDLRSIKFWLALIAEFIGTGLLVLVGCGSCITGDVVRISLCFGLCVATIVWVIAHVSGGHINPGVTIGFLVTRKISILRAILYIIVQSVGAVTGAGILKGLTATTNITRNVDVVCTPTPSPGVTLAQTFGVEAVITFVLVLTVFATCDSVRTGIGGSGPLAIGLSITMCHLWAAPYEGSGMNPARTFGSAVVSGKIDQSSTQAMYWFGPLFGGVVAALLYDLVFAANASIAKATALFTKKDYDDSHFGAPESRPSAVV